MPSAKDTRFLHVCTQCGAERFTTKKHNPSGLCAACARLLGRLPQQLHFLPGAVYAEESLIRFWLKVDKESTCTCHAWEDRCWPWIGLITATTGYGSFALDGRPIGAHRFAYQAEHGLVARGIYVLHRPPCLMRHCVRHLYAGTPKQNTADIVAMNGLPTGDAHWTRRHPELLLRGEKHAQSHRGYSGLPRGDDHWTHKQPALLKSGDDHWTHKHPERVARGEKHAQNHRSYRGLPRGDDHWTHKYPERVARGKNHWTHKE